MLLLPLPLPLPLLLASCCWPPVAAAAGTVLRHAALPAARSDAVHVLAPPQVGAVRNSLLLGHGLGAGAARGVLQLGKAVARGAGLLLRVAGRLPLLGLGWLARRRGLGGSC